MRSWRPLSETIHLIALGVWLGALLMTAVAAGVIFATVKALDPALPGYAAYTGEHWRLAGGQIAAGVLVRCDLVQFVCAMVALVSASVLVLVAKVPARRPAVLVRLAFLGAAVAGLGGYFFFLAPRMNGHMVLYWAAALRGDNDAAQTARAAFDRLHPIATALFGVTMLTVLLSLVFGAWSACTPERNAGCSGAPRHRQPRQEAARLEEPMLLRSQR